MKINNFKLLKQKLEKIFVSSVHASVLFINTYIYILNLIKIKNVCLLKDTVKGMKR